MRKLTVVALIPVVIMRVAQAQRPANDLLLELTAAEQHWATSHPTKYAYTLREGGAFGYSTIRITVVGDGCKARSRYTFGSKVSAWKSDTCEDHTIDALFSRLRQALHLGVETFDASYDHTLGYVKEAKVYPHTDFEDSGWNIAIENFRELR